MSDYVYKPHEKPLMVGSPASPDHPTTRRVAYLLIAVLIGITGGFQNGLLMANLAQIQGSLGLSAEQGGWLMAAYTMTNACMSMLLFKVRQQFGLDRFVRMAMVALVLTNGLQLFNTSNYGLELLARGIGGFVGSALSTLCMFYFMQGLPAKARIAGLLLGTGVTQIATPLARVISPELLADGNVTHLFQLQFGLSLATLGAVRWLHLPQGDTADVFEWLDILSFGLFAMGIALLCAYLVQGRILGWETPWLGWALAGAIVCTGTSLLIERNRHNPMMMVGWMTSGQILAFAFTGAMLRVLLSEQTAGAAGLMSTLGMSNNQMIGFYGVITVATIAGLLLSVVQLDPTDLTRPVLVALALVALGAFMDVGASNLTRPAQLYVSQAVIAFAAIYFMGPMMLEGMLRALAKGPQYIISFSAVFGISQALGGLAGAAGLAQFQTWRAKAHAIELGTHALTTDPLVAQRIQQQSGALASSLTDPLARQAQGSAALVQQIWREANVLAFNDVFLLIGACALLALAVMSAMWVNNRLRGYNPLAQELAAIKAMMERK